VGPGACVPAWREALRPPRRAWAHRFCSGAGNGPAVDCGKRPTAGEHNKGRSHRESAALRVCRARHHRWHQRQGCAFCGGRLKEAMIQIPSERVRVFRLLQGLIDRLEPHSARRVPRYGWRMRLNQSCSQRAGRREPARLRAMAAVSFKRRATPRSSKAPPALEISPPLKLGSTRRRREGGK